MFLKKSKDPIAIIELYTPDGQMIKKFIAPPKKPVRWHYYAGITFGLLMACPFFGNLPL